MNFFHVIQEVIHIHELDATFNTLGMRAERQFFLLKAMQLFQVFFVEMPVSRSRSTILKCSFLVRKVNVTNAPWTLRGQHKQGKLLFSAGLLARWLTLGSLLKFDSFGSFSSVAKSGH